MSAGRAMWTLCLLLCVLLFLSQHAGAQRGAAFSIVQDVTTNRCSIVAQRATTTAEQTVLGEFGSLAEAQSRLKRILICRDRNTRLTAAERSWRDSYAQLLEDQRRHQMQRNARARSLLDDDRRQQRMSNRRGQTRHVAHPVGRAGRTAYKSSRDQIKAQ